MVSLERRAWNAAGGEGAEIQAGEGMNCLLELFAVLDGKDDGKPMKGGVCVKNRGRRIPGKGTETVGWETRGGGGPLSVEPTFFRS